MVFCTAAAVATVITGGAAAPIAASIGTGMGASAAGAGTSVALATAVGVGTSGGAIVGAGATSTAAGAIIGAAAGGTSAAGVASSGMGLAALTAGTGGLGLLAVGAAVKPDTRDVTYDCWKPVVHDTTEEPSDGMLLRDLISHSNISSVHVTQDSSMGLPSISLENVWSERFTIQYLLLHDTGRIVCHAKRV